MVAVEDEGGGGGASASPLRRRPQAQAAAATAAPAPQQQQAQQDPQLLGRPILLLFLLWAVLLYVRDMAGSDKREAAAAPAHVPAMGAGGGHHHPGAGASSPMVIKPEPQPSVLEGAVDGGVQPVGVDPLGASLASGGDVKHVLVQYCTS